MSGTEAFIFALRDLLEGGRRPPCSYTTPTDNDWLSDSQADQQAAALRCQPCPLLDVCEAMGTETKSSFGVFGGRIRTRFPKPPKSKEIAGPPPRRHRP